MNDQADMNKGFLKDKLGTYQVDPPEKVWSEISAQTGGGRKRRGLFIILIAAAASFALALTLGLHFFGPDLSRDEAYVEELSLLEEAIERSEKTINEKEEGSKLEQKVVLKQPDSHKQANQNRSLALTMQSMALAQESEGKTLPDTLHEQNDLQEVDEFPDSVVLLEKEELSDLNGDPDLMLPPGKNKDPRWMLGAALSPLYSFRDAEAEAMTNSPAETGLLSYSTGIYVSYRRNSRLAIETGIYFNKTGISIGAPGIQVFNQAYDNMIFGAGSERADIRTVSNSVGNIIAYSGDIYMNGYKINAENSTDIQAFAAMNDVQTSDQGIQQHLDYLELPFNLRYSIVDRTIELQLVGGMSANFLVNNYVSMEGASGQEEIGYLSNVKAINYSGNAGLGMIYHLGEKLCLNLEPRFRYFINSVNDSSLPSTRPYSIGFYTGLSYTF